ncbi:MAG: glycosyl transferase [Blautia sp.]|nr:glycosyl transferase [Blautia sp.]
MIPKKIHYCWFGKNPKPVSVEKCIASWRKYCPDYVIIEHNEENYDITKHIYMKQAYEHRKWAFVTDYARLDILYEQGGIYLDTDVELIKSLDGLLDCNGFMGFEDEEKVATGLGMGAEKKNPVVAMLMQDYQEAVFVKEDGSFDLTPCTRRNTDCLIRDVGLKADGSYQKLNGFVFYPREYFAPKGAVDRTLKYLTKNTVSIHHYDASWATDKQKRDIKILKTFGGRIGGFIVDHLN